MGNTRVLVTVVVTASRVVVVVSVVYWVEVEKTLLVHHVSWSLQGLNEHTYIVVFGEIVLIAVTVTITGARVVVELDVTVGDSKLKSMQAVEI